MDDQTGRIRHIKQCTQCNRTFEGHAIDINFYVSRSKYDGLKSQCKRCESDASLKYRHGKSYDELSELLMKQGGKCAICEIEIYMRTTAHVDHDHKTGKIRGILCRRCNTTLGFVENNKWMLAVWKYLARGRRK